MKERENIKNRILGDDITNNVPNPEQKCGICNKIRGPHDGENWDLENGSSYRCPDCTVTLHGRAQLREMDTKNVLPDKIPIECNGMEGMYLTKLHLVICMCSQCEVKRQKIGDWERHTGCRAKKWKCSVLLKGTKQPLIKLLEGDGAESATGYIRSLTNSKLDEDQFSTLLEGDYQHLDAIWTSEQCCACGLREDYDNNKIIICCRCLIAVHQDCYGLQGIKDYNSWVCRSCETPDIERVCCLCPIKGGALKPTNKERFWVHVACAKFHREVDFLYYDRMEPVVGIFKLPTDLFLKKCTICEQIHGPCIKCYKCTKFFHATCALRAGYKTNFAIKLEEGKERTRSFIYCIDHRPSSSYDTRALAENTLKSQRRCNKRPKLYEKEKLQDNIKDNIKVEEGSSCARCRTYEKSSGRKKCVESSFYRGILHHSLEKIRKLNKNKDLVDNKIFISHLERLQYLKSTIKHNVCFGKSCIHGWGLFTCNNIKMGQMVIEYCGEKVRRSITDLREALYNLQGKDCYFFKINEEVSIDATNKGNLARLFNHSCNPNCYARVVNVGECEDRIVFFAKTDISFGEELTIDYLFGANKNLDQKIPCLCNAPNCRKFMD